MLTHVPNKRKQHNCSIVYSGRRLEPKCLLLENGLLKCDSILPWTVIKRNTAIERNKMKPYFDLHQCYMQC